MTKDLFIRYLEGKCTEEEFEQILSWFRGEARSISEKENVQSIWDEYEPESGPVERVKYSRLLDKIHHQININQNSSHFVIHKTLTRKRIWTAIVRVAAMLLLPVLGLFIYTNLSDNERYADNMNDLEVQAPAGSRMHIELGDGTKVYLNHGSKLKYPYRFGGDSRVVYLVGEAYFEVAHNEKVPFIVGTNHLDIKATGTAFNVCAYSDDDVVETTLVEGKVILSERKNNTEIKTLSPGEYVKFNIQKNSYSVKKGNTLKYTSWKDGLLVFENDNVEEIAKKLARWYNVDVEITDQKINEYPFTATFTDETLPQVLELLSLATPVRYQLTSSKKMEDGRYSRQKVLIGLKNKI